MSQLDTRVPVVTRSRLTPPPAHADDVIRDELLALIDNSRCQVTLIAAPHGSGKTVALAQWAHRQRNRSAWVSLTGTHEGSSIAVWAAVVESLALAHPELPLPRVVDVTDADRVVDRFVPELLNALAFAGPVTLILDGLEQVSDPSAWEGLGHFLLQLPPQLKVLLSTNQPAAGPVPRLRAAGRLVELPEDALRFSLAEARELFTRSPADRSSPELIDGLHASLRGWAVGLRIASGRALDGAVGAIPYEVLDYVRVAVLDRAPVRERDALLRASVLPTLRCETVAAVAGSRAARALTSFADSSLLVQRIPEGWVCHPALRAAADEQLRRIDPELRASLQARAVQRLVHEHDFVAAAECAAQAGLATEASDCVVAAWPAADPERLLHVVTSLAARVPAHVAAVGAAAALACGSIDRATDLLATVEDPEVARAVRSQLCLQIGDLDGAAKAIDGADRSRPGRVESWYGVLTDIAAGALDLWGDRPGRAIWRLEEAAGVAARADYTDAHLRALDLLVACAHLTDNPDLARTAARAAVQSYRRQRLRPVAPAIAISYLGESVGRWGSENPTPVKPLPGPHHLAFASYLRAIVAARSGDPVRHRLAQSEARSFLLPDSAGPLLRSLLDDGEFETGRSDQQLTDREAVVLRALAGPLTLREIARELHVSHNTVKSQVSSLFRKLGAHDRVGAIRAARDLGLGPR